MQSNIRCFRIAASYIRSGWVQGEWRDDDGNVCLLQAVIDAMSIKKDAATLPFPVLLAIDTTLVGMGTYCVTAEEKAHRLNILIDRDAENLSELIWSWNDADGRTNDEVVKALEKTADRLEGENRLWLRDIISRAIRPSSRRYAEDEELVYAADE